MHMPACQTCHSRVCEHMVGPFPRISRRRAQVLLRLSGGLSNREIAGLCGITEGTVKVYLSRIFSLVGVKSRLEAALWARDHAAELLELAA